MVPIRSKHEPDMVPKSRHFMDMDFGQCLLSLEKIRALAGLEVKMGKTLSQHGPDMVPKNKKIHSHGPYSMLTQP